ncbi:hypothetical protein B0H14DRAFT_2664794 [Mycena olivaceomarginata]|nr:hypothetical protein B0H14DRAFT_2664794 [Mycena olivaceomarginata]
MAALDPALIAILHHSVSNKSLRLDISGEMISPAIWTETLASSEGQLEQLRALGNWVLYSSLLHHALSVIPSRGPKFFEIITRCILHPNIYTQLLIKTRVYAADEDPFNVLEDQIAADAFVLLCAVLLKTAGSKTFLSWFWKHFGALFIVADQATPHSTMARGSQFLREQNQCCFPEAVAGCTPKKIPHFGLPGGPLSMRILAHPVPFPQCCTVFKSLALLRRLEQRLTPLCAPPFPLNPRSNQPTISAPCCTLEKPHTAPAIPPQTTLLQQPTSLPPKENILRSQLVSRRKLANKISKKPAPKQGRCRSQSRKRSQRPLFDFSNLPLRAQ